MDNLERFIKKYSILRLMEGVFICNPMLRKVDEKGRIKVPKRFTPAIKDGLLYTNYIEDYLVRCYTKGNYEKRIEEMLAIPADDSGRQLFFLAERSTIDSQNRLTLKGPISKLERVIIAANGDVFDIYNPNMFPYKSHLMREPEINI